jgi:hypothetical protein
MRLISFSSHFVLLCFFFPFHPFLHPHQTLGTKKKCILLMWRLSHKTNFFQHFKSVHCTIKLKKITITFLYAHEQFWFVNKFGICKMNIKVSILLMIQWLGGFFCKGPGNKYSRLCRIPNSLCHCRTKAAKDNMNGNGYIPIKLNYKAGSSPIWSGDLIVLIPDIKNEGHLVVKKTKSIDR